MNAQGSLGGEKDVETGKEGEKVIHTRYRRLFQNS